MKKIDARGLSCPEPVMLTQAALKTETELEIIADCPAAKENITRYATENGFTVDVKENNGEFTFTIRKK